MLAQQLVNGLLLGATYALFALGFTLMFGVLKVINLTYGFYFSAGALVALWLVRSHGSRHLDRPAARRHRRPGWLAVVPGLAAADPAAHGQARRS